MNDLFSGSFSRPSADLEAGTLQMTTVNLDSFLEEVEAVKQELREVQKLHRRLQSSNEQAKTVHNAKAMKDLRATMDADVAQVLKKAKLIKVRVESFDRSNESNRTLPGCGPGSSTDRVRTSVVAGLRKELKDAMDDFQALRTEIMTEYRETIERRYFTVTGEKPDERTVEILISTGESETFLRKAIQEQGRGQVLDTITEIQERHESVREMEKNLLDLHQVFLDMSVLVHAQGEKLDNIESHVARASSYVEHGVGQLVKAKEHQKNTRKWTCIGIVLLIIIILVIVLPIVLTTSGK